MDDPPITPSAYGISSALTHLEKLPNGIFPFGQYPQIKLVKTHDYYWLVSMKSILVSRIQIFCRSYPLVLKHCRNVMDNLSCPYSGRGYFTAMFDDRRHCLVRLSASLSSVRTFTISMPCGERVQIWGVRSTNGL